MRTFPMVMISALLLAGALFSAVGAAAHTMSTLDAPHQALPANYSEQGKDPVLIAAGDIADCRSQGDEATARLIRTMAGTIATLGDNAYQVGSKQQFADCFGPTWGAEKGRTKPAPGNHEYGTRGARGYFGYFGAAAGNPRAGYYSYDLGAWHIVVLNSNCDEVGGCAADSPQGRWLRKDLAAHRTTCTLAYWHHPLFSSGKEHGGDSAVRPLWEALYDAGADVVLSGHEHNYERFAPQDPSGALDSRNGIRQFVVGTGGAGHYAFGKPQPNSEVRNSETYGVLAVTLKSEGYDWEFSPADSPADRTPRKRFTDSGSAGCR